MRRIIGSTVFALVMAVPAYSQQCPQPNPNGPNIPSETRTLQGKLIFHDSIRKWFELKLDQPECGQPSTELVPENVDDWKPLEVLRGCHVRSKGKIDFSPTGYYSLDTYQAVHQIEPVSTCARRSAFPDYSKVKPDKSIRTYRVEMTVKYGEPGDHPIIFRISSAGKELRPWQAYASYSLTGGFVLYGHCGEGFTADKVFGDREATPSLIDWPAFDPESAAASGKKELHLGYTCVRDNE